MRMTAKTSANVRTKTLPTWRKLTALVIIIASILGCALLLNNSNKTAQNQATDGKLQIVAAENFWGSLVSQLGGNKVHVTSIVSDPNADPHEYETNTTTARTFDAAQYVVLNGAGYDSWASKLLSANGGSGSAKTLGDASQNASQTMSGRTVFTVATLLGKKNGDNPHFWYNPSYVNQVAAHMEQDLIRLDPNNASYYRQQDAKLQVALSGYQDRILSIKKQFGGTKVAATEDIFAYLANAAGLNLISPPSFIEAVAEGNDPPTGSVVQFQNQLQSGQAKLLVYNQQTVTPLTENMKKLAAQQGIPDVGVTETIQPPNTSFEDWMNAQLINLENALNAQALGQ